MIKILNWIKANKFLVGILFLGAILRLYRISEYMTFLGDEGRDAIVVRNLLVHADPVLIGPGTSIGGMYLGPLYYYLIAPSLFLANFSPLGPSVFVAIVGVITIWMVYKIGTEWFSKRAGIMASLFYAVSPTVIIYSRSSWNPNVMPFFALLTIYSVWRFWKKNQYIWLVVCAVSFAFVLQSHYLGLILVPLIGSFWFLEFLKLNVTAKTISEKAPVSNFVKYSIISLTTFALLMSPLLIFDLRHNWINTNAMTKFFVERQTTVSAKPWNAFPKIPEIASRIATTLVGAGDKNIGNLVLAIVSVPSVLFLLSRRRLHKNEASGFLFLSFWILLSLFGFGVYKQEIYDHYFGFVYPAVFLFLGGFIDGVLDNLSKFGLTLVYFLVFILIGWNLYNSPVRKEPNSQMQRAQKVAEKIGLESDGAPFNLAVIAERNYEDGYQYFLEKDALPIKEIDAQILQTVTDQLFVVCEVNGSTLTKDTCDPTHSAKTEVANFGWSKIENQWEVFGVVLYKLVHSN